MSKTKLALKLAEHGMADEHRRELGTPLEIRGLYRAGHDQRRRGRPTARTSRRARRASSTRWRATSTRGAPTALLCLEADRRVATGGWWRSGCEVRRPELEVVDL